MGRVQVHTNADFADRGTVPVQGTRVFVGDVLLENVAALELLAEPAFGLWSLQISVHVDPATLFVALPPRKVSDA